MPLRRLLLLATCGVLLLSVVGLAWFVHDAEDERIDHGLEEFLQPWYDAVDGQEDEPAKVVFIGDSITEGVLLDPPVRERRTTGVLQRLLRDELGIEGGEGYVPAFYADPTTRDETVRNGPEARQESFGPWGLGGRALSMPGGASLTYPRLPATRVRVWYGRSSFVSGHGKVFVDDVDVTAQGTLSDGSDSPDRILTAAYTNSSGVWWESPELEPGEHRVEVRSVASDAVFVHTGVEFLDGDEDSGVHVYDGAHSGARTSDFASEGALAGHWADVAAIDPQLVVVNLGTNRDEAHLENLRTLVERALLAAPRAQVVLVDGYEAGIWETDAWEQVRRDKREVAAEHPDRVAVFDLAAHWPTLAKDGSTNQGLMIDAEKSPLHLSEKGHTRMAEIYADLLLPPD